MTYQKVTGPLMANSHPGSYTGQDAWNDMLVTAMARGCQKPLTQAITKELGAETDANGKSLRSTQGTGKPIRQAGGVET